MRQPNDSQLNIKFSAKASNVLKILCKIWVGQIMARK